MHYPTSQKEICKWNVFLINLCAERHGNDERHFEVMAVDLVCALNVDTNVGFTAVSEKI